MSGQEFSGRYQSVDVASALLRVGTTIGEEEYPGTSSEVAVETKRVIDQALAMVTCARSMGRVMVGDFYTRMSGGSNIKY